MRSWARRVVDRLPSVAGEVGVLVAVHGIEVGIVGYEREQCPLALGEQHVADVAGVLERGPHLRLGPHGAVVQRRR